MSYKQLMRILEKTHLKNGLRRVVNSLHYHKKSEFPDIFIFSTPRSGSTLLMDIIAINPQIKGINEPLHKRSKEYILKRYIDDLRWRYVEFSSTEKKELKKYFDYLIYERMCTYPVTFDQHHWFTDRCLIKCLRAPGQEEWFMDNFDIQSLYLIRHPIPASLSRIRNGWGVSRNKVSFQDFFSSSYHQENILDTKVTSLIENKIESGSILDLQVIKWCLENIRTIKNIERLNNLVFLTYEELTVKSKKVINFLSDHLNLPRKDKMLELINIPSHSSNHSQEQTTDAIKDNQKQYLIEKWRKEVSPEDVASIAEILEIFEIDIYDSEAILPNTNYTKFL